MAGDLTARSATDLRTGFLRREHSPVEVVEAILVAIERETVINAYVTVAAEQARAQARVAEQGFRRGAGEAPPLLGIPVSVKDTMATRGLRTTMGSRLFADWVPDADAPAVAAARAAGAVLVGKTNTSELGWKGTTDNLLFGATRNPWRTERTSGGSSGGAAAAVAAGLGPVALGTDAAGSLRIPAAFCGVVGFKPTHGLVATGAPGKLGLVAHHGPIAATVADIALVLGALAPRQRRWADTLDAGVEGVVVGWCADLGYGRLEDGVGAVAAACVGALAEAGARVREISPGLDDPHGALWTLLAAAAAEQHGDEFARVREDCEPGRAAFVEEGRRVSPAQLAAALATRDAFRARLDALMETVDLIALPTMPGVAFALEAPAGGTFAWSPNTYPFNLTGQPAISVPCGTHDGLPVGLELVGRRGDDALVLAAAAACERMRPWPPRAPVRPRSAGC